MSQRSELIDPAIVTPFVRVMYRDDALQISGITCRPIHAGGGEVTRGLFRLGGDATGDHSTQSWSLILKITGPPVGHSESADDWRREALAYASPTLHSLPVGIAAPRCLGVTTVGDEFWIWLEDLAEPDRVWSIDQYREAARHLGRFNGAYLTSLPTPTDAWWSRGWLRLYVDSAARVLARLPTFMDHVLAKRLFPGQSLGAVNQLWATHAALLDHLDHLAVTLCHLDANRRNLFLRPGRGSQSELVLVDWAFSGMAPIGQELAALVVGSVLLYEWEPEDLSELETAAISGYLQGLEEAGWKDDFHRIRTAFAVSAAMRYIAYTFVRLPMLVDDRRREWGERVLGRPLEDVVDRWISVRHYLFDLAADARKSIA